MRQAKLKQDIEDNVDTRGLVELLKDSTEPLDELLDFMFQSVEELEYTSRDGFIPHSHNKGGVDFIGITSIKDLYYSGSHHDTNIEVHVNECFNYEEKELKENHPELKFGSDEYYEKLDEYLEYEGNQLAFRVRIMYEGDGVIMVHSGWDLDGPYFRWTNKTDLEQKIKFKDKRDLKPKLRKAIEKAIKKM